MTQKYQLFWSHSLNCVSRLYNNNNNNNIRGSKLTQLVVKEVHFHKSLNLSEFPIQREGSDLNANKSKSFCATKKDKIKGPVVGILLETIL